MGTIGPSPESAADERHAKELGQLRLQISADGNIERQLRHGGEPGLLDANGIDDQTLLRWLRAEKYNVDKAFKRLQSHAQWRLDYVPSGRIEESEIEPELAANKTFLQGHDKKGQPLVVCIVKRHSSSKRVLEKTKRFIAYTLDNAIHTMDLNKNPTGKVVAVFDLRGLGFDCLDRHVLQAVFDLLQNHYPERLGRLWMYEAPTMFWGIWQLVSPFIDPTTKEKVVFVSSKTATNEFQDAIDLAVLPKELGGQSDLIPVQDYVGLHLLKAAPAATAAAT